MAQPIDASLLQTVSVAVSSLQLASSLALHQTHRISAEQAHVAADVVLCSGHSYLLIDVYLFGYGTDVA